jgi:hypothetical protein
MARPFFCKEWLDSQNWDRQPTFKFDKDTYVLCIYCMMPRNMHLDVEWSMNATISLKKRPIERVRNKKVNSSKETRRYWYHARYEARPNFCQIWTQVVHPVREKKRHRTFSKGIAQPFFNLFSAKNDLFLRTEIDNLRSNLTRIRTCFVYIALYQETCIWMSNGFMNAILFTTLHHSQEWKTKILLSPSNPQDVIQESPFYWLIIYGGTWCACLCWITCAFSLNLI